MWYCEVVVPLYTVQRQKQMAHLEKELSDAAVEDNKKLRLRLVKQISDHILLTRFSYIFVEYI